MLQVMVEFIKSFISPLVLGQKCICILQDLQLNCWQLTFKSETDQLHNQSGCQVPIFSYFSEHTPIFPIF